MATSIRIGVGLEVYQFETDSPIRVDAGVVLRPRDAMRLIRRLRAHERRKLRPLVSSAGRRSLHWHDDFERVLAESVANGRIRVRKLEAKQHRVAGTIPEEPELETSEPIQNEIVDVHSVMIELVDVDGNPVPGEPFRIKLPDGQIVTSTLDAEGKAHITGIEQAGTCKVCFYERDAAVWAPA